MDDITEPITSPQPAVLAVVPARLASSRLPAKLLLRETGKSVLQHTIMNIRRARLVDRVVVATADQEIASEAVAIGCPVAWTSPTARCGTERLAEIATRQGASELYVNVQGDEPELPPEYIDQLIQMMLDRPTVSIGTLAAPLTDPDRVQDASCVKVVIDQSGRALYFSRCPIPYAVDRRALPGDQGSPAYWQHLGIYAFRRHFLNQYWNLPTCAIEQAERLEQLRFLHAGFGIQVGRVPQPTRGIDTPEDYRAFVARIRGRATLESAA
jgi:3-deoxy-manno-octulosonate cytidylyltransferase (CMP-KDO synthetase)